MTTFPLLASGFLWGEWLSETFSWMPKLDESNIHLFHALIVFLVISTFAVLYKLSLGTVEQEAIPSDGVSVKNVVQTLVESLLKIMKGVIPHHTSDYLPLIGSVFIFILLSNLMGTFPGFMPPTASFFGNLAIALTVFIYYNAMGIKRTGIKAYLAHFMGPIWWMAPLMFVIEIVSHCVRPISLSLRLFGNIDGDHKVLEAFTGLAPFVVPVIFLAFGIFVSFIQAFVFTLLSSIYLGLAVETHHGDHH